MSQLTQPAELLATMFVPDRKLGPDVGRKYGLAQIGECFYVLLFRNPEMAIGEQHPHLDGAPVAFLHQQEFFPDSQGEANEHGHLFFRTESDARAWFEVTSEAWNGEISLEERGSMLLDTWLSNQIGASYNYWNWLLSSAELLAKVTEHVLEAICDYREIEKPEQYRGLIEKRVRELMEASGP